MVVFFSVLVLWIVSLCLHEYAHARVAYAGGDISVIAKGYLSLNPLAYLHPFTSVILPVIILAIGGIPLPGGAVYIDRSKLQSPAWDSMVSAAGPAANLLLAVLSGLPFALGIPGEPTHETLSNSIWLTLAVFCLLQCAATILNLLPIPGLDGFGIIAPYLPPQARDAAYEMSTFLIIALIIVLMKVEEASVIFWNLVRWLPELLNVDIRYLTEGWNQFRAVLP